MSKQIKVTDRRLLAALDYIDQQYIDDVFDLIKEPEPADQKSSRFKVWKQVITLAACLVLVAAAFPVIKYVIINSDFFAGSVGTETPETTNGMYDEYILTEEDLAELNEAYFREIISNSSYSTLNEEQLDKYRAKFKFASTIEQAMYRPSERPVERDDYDHIYIGKYGECIAIAFPGSGLSLAFTSPRIKVCYNSEFYSLTTAQENGFLTDSEAEMIRDFIDTMFSEGRFDEHILTEEELAELNEAYFRRKISDDPTYAEMDEATLNEMRNSKYCKFAETVEQAMQRKTTPWSTFYFGRYGDCIVVAINGMLSLGYPFELCGYRFLYTHTTMLVCYDSNFYYMEKAYEMGLLSESNVERLYRTYTEYYSEHYFDIPEGLKIVPSDSPIELSDAEEREIVWSYIKFIEDKDKLDYTYSVKCYGKFDGMYAVMIDVSGMYYTDGIRFERVYDVEFVFPNGQKMYVYRWGDFYSLSDGVLKEDDVMSILWSKRTAFTYSETSSPIALDKYEIEDILRAYVDIHNEPGDKDLDYSLRCYGTFHENRKHIYVVFVDQTGKTYDSKVTREEVNGLVFEYPTEQTLLVYPYDKHEFHTLTEAFESGLLTADELYQIYTAYNTNE